MISQKKLEGLLQQYDFKKVDQLPVLIGVYEPEAMKAVSDYLTSQRVEQDNTLKEYYVVSAKLTREQVQHIANLKGTESMGLGITYSLK